MLGIPEGKNNRWDQLPMPNETAKTFHGIHGTHAMAAGRSCATRTLSPIQHAVIHIVQSMLQRKQAVSKETTHQGSFAVHAVTASRWRLLMRGSPCCVTPEEAEEEAGRGQRGERMG
ncbi:hypothetical protein TESG_08584 [Trichophyton tonsurans CBS 112818]|uniref:Uncharacterized protein n=2 Tax=Trichophyton TaxID=5550 RepID=F2PR44_TRIEC|nr:hypothetical protein TESG_08584 [Trichophyton tonsurans CBS 112818]EGE04362.1 hypothetical protein TEQG_03565 [Trichophyton equinum CBS 127.97]